MHARARHSHSEIRVFARALCDASPTRVARNVDHRRESPMHSGRARFGRGDVGRALGGRGVEARGFAEWDGKDSPVAVNHVEAEDERNLQTRPLDRGALKVVRFFCPANPKSRAETPCARNLKNTRIRVPANIAAQLLQLP